MSFALASGFVSDLVKSLKLLVFGNDWNAIGRESWISMGEWAFFFSFFCSKDYT